MPRGSSARDLSTAISAGLARPIRVACSRRVSAPAGAVRLHEYVDPRFDRGFDVLAAHAIGDAEQDLLEHPALAEVAEVPGGAHRVRRAERACHLERP